jgi:hypothetical protein
VVCGHQNPPHKEGFFINNLSYFNINFMTIKMTIRNILGVFESEKMTITTEQYKTLIEKSKDFYENGFEMWLENGFMIVAPEIVKQSILSIDIID